MSSVVTKLRSGAPLTPTEGVLALVMLSPDPESILTVGLGISEHTALTSLQSVFPGWNLSLDNIQLYGGVLASTLPNRYWTTILTVRVIKQIVLAIDKSDLDDMGLSAIFQYESRMQGIRGTLLEAGNGLASVHGGGPIEGAYIAAGMIVGTAIAPYVYRAEGLAITQSTTVIESLWEWIMPWLLETGDSPIELQGSEGADLAGKVKQLFQVGSALF